jgi:hypothetical protein
MRISLIIVFMLLVSVGYSQELPKSIRVHFTNFIEMHTDSQIPLDSAFYFPDVQSYETTDCTYLLDFQSNECSVYFEDSLVGKAPIISVQQVEPTYRTEFDVWEYIIKLDDVSIDTEIRISIESNSFLYSYGLDDINHRIIQFPISTVITVSE